MFWKSPHVKCRFLHYTCFIWYVSRLLVRSGADRTSDHGAEGDLQAFAARLKLREAGIASVDPNVPSTTLHL